MHASRTSPASRIATVLGIAIITVVALTTLAPILDIGFLGDDTDDWVLSCGLETPQGRSHVFGAPFAHFYRPLTSLTFALDRARVGLEARGYHATDLLLHLLASLALFALVREGLGRDTRATALGLGAALLLAIHPSTLEVLCGLHCRAEPLVMIPSCLAITICLRSQRIPPWMFAAWLLLALASKEIALTVFAPIAVFAWSLRHRHGLRPLLRSLIPAAIVTIAFFIARHVILGSVLDGPEVSAIQRWAVATDILPQLFFPTVDLPARWLDDAAAPAWGLTALVTGFCGLTILALGIVASSFRHGNPRERLAIAMGASWLAAQIAIYVATAYFGTRHTYSMLFALALMLAPTASVLIRRLGRRPVPVLASVTPIAILLVLWIQTGPLTYSFDSPRAATSLRQAYLDELDHALDRCQDKVPLILAINYPNHAYARDDRRRFSFSYPDLFSRPVGHRILHQNTPSRWLSLENPDRPFPALRPLLYSTIPSDLARTPITQEKHGDRLVFHFAACRTLYEPSQTAEVLGRSDGQGTWQLDRRSLGPMGQHAWIYVFDGEKGSLSPFPPILEIRVDPSSRTERYERHAAARVRLDETER